MLLMLISFGVNQQTTEQKSIYSTSLNNQDNYYQQIDEPKLTTAQILKINKQLSLLRLTLGQIKDAPNPISRSKYPEQLAYIEKSRFFHVTSKKLQSLTPTLASKRINVKKISNQIVANQIIAKQKQNKRRSTKKKSIDITDHLRILQLKLDDIDLTSKYDLTTHIASDKKKRVKRNSKRLVSKTTKNIPLATQGVNYWQTVHSIESKQGKLLYRPRNKAKNCTHTSGPCGHHQLTVQALKDIGCHSQQCRKDRLNYKKSLNLSKKLLALNEQRLRKNGISNLKGYEKYLIHQQGAHGIKSIIAATKGKKTLSKKIKKNMANNSPYSYKQFKRMGSKAAAKKFMYHWKNKWTKEQRLVLASTTKSNDSFLSSDDIATFSDNDLNYALNLRF